MQPQARIFDIFTVAGLNQAVAITIQDTEGETLDLTGCTFNGSIRFKSSVVPFSFEIVNNEVIMSWNDIAAGIWDYDMFMVDGGGIETPLLIGRVFSRARIAEETADATTDIVGHIVIKLADPDGKSEVSFSDLDSARWYANQAKQYASEIAANLEASQTAATSAEEAAERAEAALEQIPVDEGGNMSISGGLTVAGVANLNGGASVPATATLTLAGTVSAGNEVFSGEVMASMYWAAALYYGTQFEWNRANILRYFSTQALSGGGTGAGLAAIPDDTPMPSNLAGLTNGESLFSYSTLKRLPAAWTFDNLVNGLQMFANAALEELPAGMVLGSLTNGRLMFVHLRTATSLPEGLTLASLQNGRAMFSSVKLTGLPESLNLGALTDGYTMFQQARLDKESAVRVLGTLSAMTDGAEHIFTIGIAAEHEGDADVAAAVAGAEAKGWTVDVRFNS